MAVITQRNAEHYMLETSDLLTADNKNFVFEAYDNQVNSFTSQEVQTFNTVRLNTAPEIYDFSSNILTVARAGIYLFTIRMALQSSGAADAEAAFFLQEDPDTGSFSTVTGTTCYIAMPATMRQTAQITVPLRVGFDYRYQVSVLRTVGSGTISTLSGTPSFSCLCLFQNG